MLETELKDCSGGNETQIGIRGLPQPESFKGFSSLGQHGTFTTPHDYLPFPGMSTPGIQSCQHGKQHGCGCSDYLCAFHPRS